MCELATRHHEAEKQGVLMRNVPGTISHPEGETMAMDVTYSNKRMPLCTSTLPDCSSFRGKQHSSERLWLTL